MTTTDIQGVMAAIHGLTEEVRAFQSEAMAVITNPADRRGGALCAPGRSRNIRIGG